MKVSPTDQPTDLQYMSWARDAAYSSKKRPKEYKIHKNHFWRGVTLDTLIIDQACPNVDVIQILTRFWRGLFFEMRRWKSFPSIFDKHLYHNNSLPVAAEKNACESTFASRKSLHSGCLPLTTCPHQWAAFLWISFQPHLHQTSWISSCWEWSGLWISIFSVFLIYMVLSKLCSSRFIEKSTLFYSFMILALHWSLVNICESLYFSGEASNLLSWEG